MNLNFFKKKPKEKYYNEFLKENNDILFKLNRYAAIILFLLEIIAIFAFDFKFSSYIKNINQEIIGRIFLLMISIILFVSSSIKSLNKFSPIFTNIFVFSLMFFSANFLLNSKEEYIMSTIWMMVIMLFLGMYPISLRSSLIIFLISFFYYVIGTILQENSLN